MKLSAEQKIIKARANLIMSSPFFGTLALRMKIEPDDKVGFMSTDGCVLKYNPKAIDKAPLSKVQGGIAHTVMHPAMLHHTRRGAREIGKWNQACDYAINSILDKAGFDLPEGKYINPQYSGMSAEHIFSLLPEDPNDGNGDEGGGSGNGGGSNNDPGGDGGVTDSPNSQNQGASGSQQQQEEAEWKQALAQAAHAAKQAGKLPGELERMLEEVMKPVLPWKDILRRFMTEKCNDDFSWQRGNRRFLAQGLYLPSRRSDDAMGAMVVVIDTSGSIGENELNEFGAEIRDIHKEVRPQELIIMYCDSEINRVDRFGPEDELVFEVIGGGGTDFRPPFRWLEENNITPRALAYLTDGYGDFPQEADFPVIWAINNHDITPPFGDHFVMEV